MRKAERQHALTVERQHTLTVERHHTHAGDRQHADWPKDVASFQSQTPPCK